VADVDVCRAAVRDQYSGRHTYMLKVQPVCGHVAQCCEWSSTTPTAMHADSAEMNVEAARTGNTFYSTVTTLLLGLTPMPFCLASTYRHPYSGYSRLQRR